METAFQTEVCVIGGGPAGAATACRLARLGREVTLLDQNRSPRPHSGESLAPGILPLLDVLGVRQRIEDAGFLRPTHILLQWGHAAPQHIPGSDPPGFLVDRARFDAILLDAARDAGARVLEGVRALPPSRQQSGGWQIPIQGHATIREVRTNFLVAATGRRSLLPCRRTRTSPPTTALYAYWRNVDLADLEPRVEAGPDTWFWGAPLPDGTFGAVVFLDTDWLRLLHQELAPAGKSLTMARCYESLLEQSSLLARLCGGRVGSVRACSASTYFDEIPVGQDFIKVGEASFAIDPLSSQGVHAAIRSGLQGAIAVHTLLRYPDRIAASLEFYRQRQLETVRQHALSAAAHYAEPANFQTHTFWSRRSVPGISRAALLPPPARDNCLPPEMDTPIRLTAGAELIDTPCIDGDLVRTGRGLWAPWMDRPVVFWRGRELAPLLDSLAVPVSLRTLLGHWAAVIPPDDCLQLTRWLYRNQLIGPASAAQSLETESRLGPTCENGAARIDLSAIH